MIRYHRLFLGWKMCAIAAIVAMAHAPALAETPDLLADPTVRPDCGASPDLTRLDGALDRTALRLTAGDPIKIVAIGSSSTAGAGASSAATTYPARLSVELNRLMPRDSIAVLNRGINGQEVGEMLARLPDDVIREAPDLILWQVGTNAVLRNHPLRPRALLLRKGLRQLKTVQADVVLIDPQFAPKVLAMPEIDEMIDLIATTAQREHVGLFHRFAIMRHWHQVAGIPFDTFLSADQLHMNDWSYGCIAKLLASSIADSASRSTLISRH
jgi:acyl-CoA thioesterase I